MSIPPRVHFITLGVRDMKASRAFYEAMGWRGQSYGLDDVTFYQSGGQILGLYAQAALSADTGLADPRPGGVTLAINTQSRGEVDALFALALKAGGTALAAPKVMPWSGYTCYVADPDGHAWEFAYVTQFVPDENGNLTLPDKL